MTLRRFALALGAVVVAVVVAWLLFVGVPRRYARSMRKAAPAGSPVVPSQPGRKIKARLFYVTDDGLRLTSAERDVPFGEGTVEQARRIVEAQLEPAAEPTVSAIPQGTTLRALFVTERGEAFVDLTHEVVGGRAGGSTGEILTVYTLVNALTANLPAVTSVQILVDGKQVETLAGHVDLRRPLERNLTWVQ